MIYAFLVVGIGCGAIGVALGILGAGICAADRYQKIRASRDIWRSRAVALEGWLPREVVQDVLAQERAS
jgi:hypothetical protein